MIKDYKSQYSHSELEGHKRHPKLGIITLATLALTATAVYASFQFLGETDEVTEPTTLTAPQNEAIGLTPAETANTEVSKRVISLPLPGIKHTPTETIVKRPSEPVSSAEPKKAASTLALTLNSRTESKADVPADGNLTAESPSISAAEQSRVADTSSAKQSSPSDHQWVEEKVRSGDSLARIFSRLNLSSTLLHNMVNSSKEAKALANIKPGQVLKIRLDEEGQLQQLIHQRSKINSLKITAVGDGYKTETIDRDLETRTAEITGTITNSLFQSAQSAGLSDDLIMDLAHIFGWDIDFALEIRSGDSFSVIYEEQYLDGDKYRNGSILAAEFINRGTVHRAIRYEDEEGYASYFSPDGKSMRKAFLRAPVDFRRISSRFTKERWHPVLGKKRPHRGVDYAAKTGTPIKAAGDGKIIHLGRKGGYGKTIIIKHANRYTTLYAHMNGYKRGMKKGKRVKQGQVIGYVGSTGMSTGPHLHYEFRVNGVHRNPLTVKLPAALPIEKKYRKDFLSKSKTLLARLNSISNTMLAEANTDS